MRKPAWLLLVAFLPASCDAAFAGTELQTAIAAYNSGAYALALKHSLAATAVDKNDVTAHYYAGNCYLKLGRNDEAAKEYRTCISLQKEGAVAEHSRTALELLAQTAARTGNVIAPDGRGENAVGGNFGNNAGYTNEPQHLDSGRIKRETNEKKMEMTSSSVTALKHKQRVAEEAIKRINDGVDMALEGIPKMVPTGKRGEMEDNEEYLQAFKSLRKEADKKIEVIRQELQASRERLNAETESAKNSVDLQESHLKTQLNSAETGSGRLTPQGTSMYVRNFVNFGQRGEKIILRKPIPEQLKGKMEKISTHKQTSGK